MNVQSEGNQSWEEGVPGEITLRENGHTLTGTVIAAEEQAHGQALVTCLTCLMADGSTREILQPKG